MRAKSQEWLSRDSMLFLQGERAAIGVITKQSLASRSIGVDHTCS